MICQAFLSEKLITAIMKETPIETGVKILHAFSFIQFTSYLKNRDLMYAGMPNGWT